ncbi:MAG: hypothetical protein F6K58_29205 [Symploca sp. SIO2E9]|nr:hypothetical protein [Symploca sp. SIO2E9]
MYGNKDQKCYCFNYNLLEFVNYGTEIFTGRGDRNFDEDWGDLKRVLLKLEKVEFRGTTV